MNTSHPAACSSTSAAEYPTALAELHIVLVSVPRVQAGLSMGRPQTRRRRKRPAATRPQS